MKPSFPNFHTYSCISWSLRPAALQLNDGDKSVILPLAITRGVGLCILTVGQPVTRALGMDSLCEFFGLCVDGL